MRTKRAPKTLQQFYSSRTWQKCRTSFLQWENFVCNRCKGVATLAHHREYLTADNMHDYKIALDWDNLEALCHDCHEIEHKRRGQVTAAGLEFDDNGNIIQPNA